MNGRHRHGQTQIQESLRPPEGGWGWMVAFGMALMFVSVSSAVKFKTLQRPLHIYLHILCSQDASVLDKSSKKNTNIKCHVLGVSCRRSLFLGLLFPNLLSPLSLSPFI